MKPHTYSGVLEKSHILLTVVVCYLFVMWYFKSCFSMNADGHVVIHNYTENAFETMDLCDFKATPSAEEVFGCDFSSVRVFQGAYYELDVRHINIIRMLKKHILLNLEFLC